MGLFPALPPAGPPTVFGLTGGTQTAGALPTASPAFSGVLADPAIAPGTPVSRGTLMTMAAEAAQEAGVPPALFQALVETESGFNPNAVSSAGAMGLTQLMPGTAQALGVQNPFNPQENLAGGARYLASLLNEFHSVPLALAAYNAGPGAVQFYGGIPPYPETEAYVTRVMNLAGLSTSVVPNQPAG
jgi:soluble lytic murein transglycosylase-like protein